MWSTSRPAILRPAENSRRSPVKSPGIFGKLQAFRSGHRDSLPAELPTKRRTQRFETLQRVVEQRDWAGDADARDLGDHRVQQRVHLDLRQVHADATMAAKTPSEVGSLAV